MMRELPGGPVLRLYTFTVQVSSIVITGQGTKIPHATNSATHTHTKKSFQSQGNHLSTNMNSLTTTNLRAIIHTASRWKMGKKKKRKNVVVSHPVMSDSLWPHGLQHARLPCPSPSPGEGQTHIHWVGDAIQPSHPLTSPSALNPSQHQGLF